MLIVGNVNETRIGELRKIQGWTQERLASESGVAVRTVQRLESGKDASLETITMIANALRVQVRDLFVVVEKDEFEMAVGQLDARKSAQQSRRDAATHGFEFLYQGIGVLVVFATVVLASTGAINGLGWFIIPAYWVGGRYLFRFILRLVIDPRLDAKYPLSLPTRRTAKSGSETY